MPLTLESTKNPDTLTALHQSIEHWRRVLAGEDKSYKSNDCALCKKFHADYDMARPYALSCQGCPVMERTGRKFCYETPYWRMTVAHTDLEKKEAAQAELDFLVSLLPSENQTL